MTRTVDERGEHITIAFDVVPPALTREYLRLWPQARSGVLSKTGHLGVITRPDELSRVLDAFLADVPGARRERRLIG